jgi:multiple sugar transport system permease protein
MKRRRVHLSVAGLVIVGLYLFPAYWMVATSLKPRAEVFASPPAFVPYPPDFGSYQDEVLGNPILLRAFLNSAIIATGATLVTLAIAVPATYALARLRLRFAGSARFVTILAQMLPAIVVATPLFVLFSRVGLVNSYPGIILAVATITIPFALVILRPFFLAIPAELDDAASVDGCSVFQTFLRVGLPLVRPGLITVLLNTFIGQYGTRWDHLMAVATVIGLPIVIVFIALQRFIVGGLMAGAVKD